MGVVLGSPPVAPPVPEAQWEGITVEWIGADGSVWDLANGTEGVVLQADGTVGMHDPILTKYSSKSRGFPGKRRRGWHAEERPVSWPLHIFSNNSSKWVDTYSRFFRSISPETPGRWRVGFQDVFRELECTGVYEDGYAFTTHPTVLGWGRFMQALEADEQPYWQGDKVVAGPWSAAAPANFIQSPGAPAFHIGSASTFGQAEIANPGDVETFHRLITKGPLTTISLAVGESSPIVVPFNVSSGSTLIIDTDPRHVTAMLDGVDMTSTLGLQPLVPIPAGGTQSLVVSATGSGSIAAELTPLYNRAIG